MFWRHDEPNYKNERCLVFSASHLEVSVYVPIYVGQEREAPLIAIDATGAYLTGALGRRTHRTPQGTHYKGEARNMRKVQIGIDPSTSVLSTPQTLLPSFEIAGTIHDDGFHTILYLGDVSSRSQVLRE
jgi:hypothetical protein